MVRSFRGLICPIRREGNRITTIRKCLLVLHSDTGSIRLLRMSWRRKLFRYGPLRITMNTLGKGTIPRALTTMLQITITRLLRENTLLACTLLPSSLNRIVGNLRLGSGTRTLVRTRRLTLLERSLLRLSPCGLSRIGLP